MRLVGTSTFLAFILLLGLNSCALRRGRTDSSQVTLRLWHVWGGALDEGMRKLIAAFEATHPNRKIQLVFAANDLSTNQKFFTAVAARKTPEIIFVDGPQVAPWAEWGALEPLTERLQQAGIREEDYFPPCWRQNTYQNDVWALTFCADPNFAFAWNKERFREVGLDPEKPPRTLAELDAFAEKLTEYREEELREIGLIPWAQYGMANSIFTWGWAFGGDFFDYERNRLTAAQPRVRKALEWMCSYAEKFDVTRVSSLQQGFGTAEQNPFYTGQVAMQCVHIGEIANIRRYAPDLDYGLAPLPQPEGGVKNSSWVGGWCLGIPRGAQHQKEAFEFLRWVSWDPVGTALVGEYLGLLPGRRDSPFLQEIRKDPHLGVFLQIMEECRHQRPVMPVQAFLMRELDRAVSFAIYGKKTPAQALADAAQNTQEELNLVLAGREGR